MGTDIPFGGKIIVFGGDFRQVLPVVLHGSEADIVDASLKRSPLWRHVKVMKLTINMRVRTAGGDQDEFEQFLLRVGDGTEQEYPEIGQNTIKIPSDIHISSSIQELIDNVYSSLATGYQNSAYMSQRAILAARNEDVDELNQQVLDRFPGDTTHTYRSSDSATETDQVHLYPTEFLNSLTPSGLPPHIIKLSSIHLSSSFVTSIPARVCLMVPEWW
jgi:hypothetical protein